MSDNHIDDHQAPLDKARRAAPAAPDERDATIARLERSVADERQTSATLRDTVEELRFKLKVLETSYSKQLADARLRSGTAEQALAEQKARLAALGSGGEDTLRLMTELRAELARVTAERDRLREQPARNDGRQTKTIAADNAGAQVQDGTINQLMAISSTLRERQAAGDGHLHAQVRADQESAPEEMIAPELVFTKKDGDEEDE